MLALVERRKGPTLSTPSVCARELPKRPAPPRRKPRFELRELRDPAGGELVWISAGPTDRKAEKAERQVVSQGCSAWWREQIRAKKHKQPSLRGAFSRLILCHDGMKYPPIHVASRAVPRHGLLVVSHDFVIEQTELLRMSWARHVGREGDDPDGRDRRLRPITAREAASLVQGRNP